MKKSAIEGFPFLKPSAKENPRLHTAVLLNPAEVDIGFKDYPSEERQKLRGLWMLVGAVNGRMYSAFKANAGQDVAAKVSVFPSPSGSVYVVVTCQVLTQQHRFVLSSFDSKVVELLASATQESISIYLECAGEHREGMLYDCLLDPETFVSVRDIRQAFDHRNHKDFIREFPLAIAEMLRLDLIPSLNSEGVCGVDVSVLLPQG